MKILFICNEYPPAPHGGIGSHTRFLAEALAHRGHSVSVIGFDPTISGPITEPLNGVTIFRHPLPKRNSSRLGLFFTFFRERLLLSHHVENLCAIFQPDIVESYDWSGPLSKKPPSGHLVIRMHGANTVHKQELNNRKKKSYLLAYAEGKNIKIYDSLVAVSTFIATKTSNTFGLSDKKITVIHNGVDTRRFTDDVINQHNPLRLLFVGRAHHHKGLDLLINSLGKVFAQNNDLFLDVVGPIDSIYGQELINSIHKDIRARINFLGRIDNASLPSIYQSANLCLLPSRVEAFPIVPLEAMACGTPVIMSSLVAANEIITHGVDGYIADPTNTESFANCILDALANQQQIESMRIACRQKIMTQFSLEKIVADNEQFYLECLQ